MTMLAMGIAEFLLLLTHLHALWQETLLFAEDSEAQGAMLPAHGLGWD